MKPEETEKKSLKQKAIHETREFIILIVYLGFFFCALATYSMLLLGKFHVAFFAYGTALVNALIIAKVILIGEAMRVGTRYEKKALLYSATWKAFVFGWLVFAFHVLEEVIERLVRGKDLAGALQDVRLDDLLLRTIVVFCTFIPLFAFRELRRVIGQDRFRAMVFRSLSSSEAKPSSGL